MRSADRCLSETDIRPSKGEATIVRSDLTDGRDWLAHAVLCRQLAKYHIRHTAVATLPAPFEIVRTHLGGSYFLACFGGQGRVLVDGRWIRCGAGRAVLLPPGTLQAFHTAPGKEWSFCWVRYQEAPGQRPLAAAPTPVLADYDCEPLRLAILGLHRECDTAAVPAIVDQWVLLVHQYVVRFAQPIGLDERIRKLWDKVSLSLERGWTSGEMSRITHLSEKQLERLCRRELGRTPRQQLIWLRMQRAASLLLEGGYKIETIADRVGYENPFVFSSTFKRVMGWSPSEYGKTSGGG